jgi:hypothetical protein
MPLKQRPHIDVPRGFLLGMEEKIEHTLFITCALYKLGVQEPDADSGILSDSSVVSLSMVDTSKKVPQKQSWQFCRIYIVLIFQGEKNMGAT